MTPTSPPAEDPDPRSAPGRLELVRAFINTLDIAPQMRDELADQAALTRWLRSRGLIGVRERLAPDDLRRALAFREGLRDLLEQRDGGAIDARVVRDLNALLRPVALAVRFEGDGATRLVPAAHGLDRALAELVAIIEGARLDGSWERLKICADHGCRWAFYDHSKNRSRSWCNMAVCGNRAKAREYRRRRRTPSTAPRAVAGAARGTGGTG